MVVSGDRNVESGRSRLHTPSPKRKRRSAFESVALNATVRAGREAVVQMGPRFQGLNVFLFIGIHAIILIRQFRIPFDCPPRAANEPTDDRWVPLFAFLYPRRRTARELHGDAAPGEGDLTDAEAALDAPQVFDS
jgi:hypothetical protein